MYVCIHPSYRVQRYKCNKIAQSVTETICHIEKVREFRVLREGEYYKESRSAKLLVL